MLQLRRLGGERGAAAVEFALIFPIFIVVAIGTMSAGTAFSKQINLAQSARETSRFGATLTLMSAGGDVEDWLDVVSSVGATAAGPQTDLIGGHDQLCVAMVDLNVVDNNKHMIDGGSLEDGPCPGAPVNAALGPRYVQVLLERETEFFAVVFNKDLTLRSASISPYEPGDDVP